MNDHLAPDPAGPPSSSGPAGSSLLRKIAREISRSYGAPGRLLDEALWLHDQRRLAREHHLIKPASITHYGKKQ